MKYVEIEFLNEWMGNPAGSRREMNEDTANYLVNSRKVAVFVSKESPPAEPLPEEVADQSEGKIELIEEKEETMPPKEEPKPKGFTRPPRDKMVKKPSKQK